MPVYNKLVRDRIPEIIEAAGKRCEVRVLGNDEYLKALQDKLAEEVQEYLHSGKVEELADLVEVVYALVQAAGMSRDAFDQIRERKARERGGFERRLFLVRVSG
jgi:predicted house-cleaning noncanonical NTP pyrophosphatase (MazG superfamily)